ncbi:MULTISPECIES: LysR substrate-binding domain-containing protein [Thalassolituus]|jgi:DNA-binding transcriptional LysR family regulator|uniref:LysR substrate-binding domain-containing protein n=1 Tax=Thalassolituus TaxID=187492 RepID=UPI00228763E0|nr:MULTISPECIES: LysR substrate-binding domain-containing protein [Thalassolituus]
MQSIPQWEGIREFVAVAESGSFTAAAVQLGLSTAQVSRQVRALEQRLGSELLFRTTRRVALTEPGQLYYQHCRLLLDGLAEAELALGNLQATPQGKLRITAPMSYGERHIAPLLNDFALRYPQIQLHYLLTNEKLDLVGGGYDMAVRLGKLDDDRLVARRLASREQYTCASPGYLAAHGEPHSLAELKQHNCLAGTLDYWRFQEQGRERVVHISGSLSANSGPALLDAALKGIGIVQLPDYYVQPYIERGELISLLPAIRPSREGIWALYPPSRNLSPKVRLLIDYLEQQLNGAGSDPDAEYL